VTHERTEKAGHDLQVLYQLPHLGLEKLSALDRVRRVMLGMGFPESSGWGYVVVVAERRWEVGEDIETQFIVVDEAEAKSPSDLLDKAVDLKDRYLATGLACPNAPPYFVEAVRLHEGLSSYPEERHPFAFRERFAHFVSTRTTCYINDIDVPDDGTIQKEMDTLWQGYCKDPITGIEMFTEKSPTPLKKMVIMRSNNNSNFSTKRAQQGVQTNDKGIRNPIWMAIKALQKSVWASMVDTGDSHQWTPGRSGY